MLLTIGVITTRLFFPLDPLSAFPASPKKSLDLFLWFGEPDHEQKDRKNFATRAVRSNQGRRFIKFDLRWTSIKKSKGMLRFMVSTKKCAHHATRQA
jgi:hypothetical protein